MTLDEAIGGSAQRQSRQVMLTQLGADAHVLYVARNAALSAADAGRRVPTATQILCSALAPRDVSAARARVHVFARSGMSRSRLGPLR